MTPPPGPGTATRRTEVRILHSARRLLRRDGATELTMRAVAEGAGITIGAIYKHFPSREALLERLVEEAFGVLEIRLLRAIAPWPPGSLERVVALGREYIAVAEEHPEEFKLLFSPFRRAPVPIEEMPGHVGYDLVRQCVSEAIGTGVFRAGDPDLMTFFLWSRVHGIITLLSACDFSGVVRRGGEHLTPEAAFELTRDLMAHGLLSAAASDS